MPSPSSAPVVVVGAGLAGLACAQRLAGAGLPVAVYEAAEAVGGRVRTDVVDGFRCDRGFQLLNPAYPVLRRVLRTEELDLRAFDAGVAVAHGSQRWVLADPRRQPARILSTVRAPLGSTAEKLRFARWAARSLLPVRVLLGGDDRSLAEELDAARVTGIVRSGVVEPFLAGVLAEREGSSSAQFARLLVRSFLLGSPSVPSLGMGRLPELIESGLPAGTVLLGQRVLGVSATEVRTEDGSVPARAVVVATDPATAGELTGEPVPGTKALTTFWHTAPEPPTRERLLHLDADARGPVVNAAVLTNVAPSYAPAGRPLVASTVLGVADHAEAESQVRAHAALIFGADTATWRLVRRHVIAAALPVQTPPLRLGRPAELPTGVFLAGDHRASASIQGALVSGRRAASAVLRRHPV